MIRTNLELAAAARQLAANFKTLYVLGGLGSPKSFALNNGYLQGLSFNQKPERISKLTSAAPDTFVFDCSGLLKALLWGWQGDPSREFGGAVYESNGVPDLNTDGLLSQCFQVSSDFSQLLEGELLWIEGHMGISIGNGLAVECTHRWADGVQITAIHNLGTPSGYNGRTWTKHGLLPWISYQTSTPSADEQTFYLTLRSIDQNKKGEDVRSMQLLLQANGCQGDMKPGLYGASGSNTAAAVRLYQQKMGLPVTGICDKTTWSRLLGLDL